MKTFIINPEVCFGPSFLSGFTPANTFFFPLTNVFSDNVTCNTLLPVLRLIFLSEEGEIRMFYSKQIWP